MVKKNPFVWENVRRFRLIALLVMIIPFFQGLWYMLASIYYHSNFSFEAPPHNLFKDFINHFPLKYILLGFVLLIMAEIFRIGTEYREDSQSII